MNFADVSGRFEYTIKLTTETGDRLFPVVLVLKPNPEHNMGMSGFYQITAQNREFGFLDHSGSATLIMNNNKPMIILSGQIPVVGDHSKEFSGFFEWQFNAAFSDSGGGGGDGLVVAPGTGGGGTGGGS